MNSGRVRSGYHFISLAAALKAISDPPSPHNNRAETTATKPMAPKIRWPVSSMTIIDENISRAISS